jgi:hypothetical protein
MSNSKDAPNSHDTTNSVHPEPIEGLTISIKTLLSESCSLEILQSCKDDLLVSLTKYNSQIHNRGNSLGISLINSYSCYLLEILSNFIDSYDNKCQLIKYILLRPFIDASIYLIYLIENIDNAGVLGKYAIGMTAHAKFTSGVVNDFLISQGKNGINRAFKKNHASLPDAHMLLDRISFNDCHNLFNTYQNKKGIKAFLKVASSFSSQIIHAYPISVASFFDSENIQSEEGLANNKSLVYVHVYIPVLVLLRDISAKIDFLNEKVSKT